MATVTASVAAILALLAQEVLLISVQDARPTLLSATASAVATQASTWTETETARTATTLAQAAPPVSTMAVNHAKLTLL